MSRMTTVELVVHIVIRWRDESSLAICGFRRAELFSCTISGWKAMQTFNYHVEPYQPQSQVGVGETLTDATAPPSFANLPALPASN